VLPNDTDPDDANSVLSVAGVEGETGNTGSAVTLDNSATVTVNGDGTFTYDPNGAFESLDSGDSDTDSFTYTTKDDGGAVSDPATVTVQVNGVNDAPTVATNAGLTLDEGTNADITQGLLEATDVDGDDGPSALTYTVESGPSNGTIYDTNAETSVNSFTQADLNNNRIEYRHDGSETIDDSFAYTVADGNGGSTAQKTFSVEINPVNDAPTISSISNKTIFEDNTLGPVSFTVSDAETAPEQLSVSGSSDNTDLVPVDSISFSDPGPSGNASVTVDPVPDSNGIATLTVTVEDPDGATGEQSFDLKVTAVNDAPVIVNNEPLPTRKDAQRTIEPQDLRTTDIESGPSALRYNVSSSNQLDNGRLLVDGVQASSFTQKQINEGEVQYDHTAQTTQDDSLDFVVADQGGSGLSVSGTFEINITSNTPPTASDTSYTVDEDQVLSVTDPANGVLANDTDPDRDPLEATIVSAPSNGSLSLNSDGTFDYEPASNFNDTDQFVYQAADGAGGTDQATVTIIVEAVNDTPQVATNTGLELDESTSAPITTTELNATDPDDAAEALTYSVTSPPTQGRLLVAGDEAQSFTQKQIENEVVQYEHTAGNATDDRFTFDLTDDAGAGPTNQTFAITIRRVNTPPTATDDQYVADQGQTLVVEDSTNGMLANDSDPDGDPLQASLASDPSNGTLSLNEDGTFEYTPNSEFNGTDAFTYEVSDGFGGTAEATVDIQVRPAQATLSATRTFPAPTQQQSFRLVALPGAVDRSLASTLSGQRGEDWRAFAETGANGSQAATREKCGEGASCRLQPGTGYWLIARNAWSVDGSVETVPLEPGSTAIRPVYRVPLQGGWNIVSNPVERDISWSAVQAASGTNQSLWRWDGGWEEAQTFASASEGVAYYFRDDDVDELVLPFPGLSSRASGQVREKTASPTDSTLALHVVADEDTVSSVEVGLRAGAEPGLDRLDRFAPPDYFETRSLRLVAGDGEEQSTLAAEHRPPGRDGYAFDLRLRAPTETALDVITQGADAFSGTEIALVRRSSGRTHDLQADSVATVLPRSSTTRFRLLIGTEAFVQEKKREITPSEVKFLPNYPNPFAQETTLEYALPERQQVRIAVYDVMGRRVQVLVDEQQRGGFHRIQWRPGSGRGALASGVYFARLKAGDVSRVERLVVVR
jgi:VCBS repeat-containing protein